MIIMGLDPSLNGFGWCICELTDHGALLVVAGDVCRVPVWSPAQRKKRGLGKADYTDVKTRRIFAQLTEAAQTWGPDVLVKEQAAGGSHQRAASHKAVGAAHALVSALSVSCGLGQPLPVVAVSAKEIKALTGGKDTSKHAVECAVLRLAPTARPVLASLAKSRREHVADAIGAVLMAVSKGEVAL